MARRQILLMYPATHRNYKKDQSRPPIRRGIFVAVEDWEDCPLMRANSQWPTRRKCQRVPAGAAKSFRRPCLDDPS